MLSCLLLLYISPLHCPFPTATYLPHYPLPSSPSFSFSPLLRFPPSFLGSNLPFAIHPPLLFTSSTSPNPQSSPLDSSLFNRLPQLPSTTSPFFPFRGKGGEGGATCSTSKSNNGKCYRERERLIISVHFFFSFSLPRNRCVDGEQQHQLPRPEMRSK